MKLDSTPNSPILVSTQHTYRPSHFDGPSKRIECMPTKTIHTLFHFRQLPISLCIPIGPPPLTLITSNNPYT